MIKKLINHLFSDLFAKINENHKNIEISYLNLQLKLENIEKMIKKREVSKTKIEKELEEIKNGFYLEIKYSLKELTNNIKNEIEKKFVGNDETRNHIVSFTQLLNKVFDKSIEIKKEMEKVKDGLDKR